MLDKCILNMLSSENKDLLVLVVAAVYRTRNAQMECICMHFKCMSYTFLKQALSSAQRGDLTGVSNYL